MTTRSSNLALAVQPSSLRSCPTPFIDRERELAELRADLASALAGRGRVALIGGEPGIGKTRLATALADEAEARGVPVLWGRGWEDGSAPAFWPWNAALRRWLDGGTDVAATLAAAVHAAGPASAELGLVFPALAEHLPVAPGADPSDSDRARFRLFDLVSRFLEALAAPAGLVIVLDDAHWADRSSLKLLEFVAAELADARILVVATYRDTEVERDDPLAATLARLARESSTRRMLLSGLDAEQCARWVASAAADVDAAALGAALHRETNGNPFFVGEIVQLLIAEAGLQSVPRGARDVIACRLARLGDACRATLEVAALLGDTIDPAVLGDVLGGASAVDDHLADARADRVLVDADGRRGAHRFAHALIRRVLVDELAPSTRSTWHARIAAVLERRASAGNGLTTEIVHHLAAAGSPDALQRAFEYACRGGDEAARGLGWEEAMRLYEFALDVGARSGLLAPRRAIELRLALARALRGVGDLPGARARCEEVMDACRRTPDATAFVRAALVFAGPVPEWGRIEPRVRAVLEEAYRLASDVDGALRARLYARLAGDLVATNAVEEGARIFGLCDEAVALAERTGDAGARAVALLGRYTASVMELGAADQDLAADAEHALAAAEAAGEHEYAAVTRYLRAMMAFAAGDAAGFARETERLATAAAATRVPEARWFAEVLTALRASVQGRFAEGREAMERALAIGERAQLPNALGVYASQRVMWHALQGRLAVVAPELEFVVETHPLGSGWRPLRALARLASGDEPAARAELHALMALGTAPAERGVMARSYLVGLASLCVALRAREHAPTLYECMARRTDAWSIGGGQTLGPWAVMLGSLARLAGRPADARRHFEDAIDLGRRMESPPIVARAQTLLASLELSLAPDAAGRERIAVRIAEAGRVAGALGIADVAARVAHLLTRAGDAPAAPHENVFHQDGEVWTVRYGGRDLRLKDGKGPRYLAALLAAPGRELHVLQFVAPAAAPRAAGASAGASEGLSVRAAIDGGEDALDESARRAYRARLEDVRAELDEAEEFADHGRAERLRTEMEHLVAELASSFGRRTARRGPAETARKAVTKVIRTQIGKLLELHPALGRHLSETIRMGTVCVYAPADSVDWDVRMAS